MTKIRKTKTMKRVQFAPLCDMYIIDDLSKSQYKDEIYWSTDELNEFKLNTRSLIEYLSLNEQDLHKIKNVFGLEKHLSAQLSFEYMQRRIIFKRAVLKEARRQRSRPPSHVDADILARKSETYSSWAREKARTSALVLLLDEQESYATATAAQYSKLLLL